MSEERTGGSYAGTTTYAYDTLGQLTRVNDPVENATWVYTYDRGGNILNKKKYAYTTGALGTPQLTIPYSYTNANWKDQLTALNGAAFEYDKIGNPTNDGTQAYEWTDGRKLAHTNNETTGMDVTYEYDHNGMRIRKSAGQHITNYTLRGDKIAYLTWGIEPNDKMRFEYDGQGRPAIVNFNGADYHYLYNLQGDVVGLIDSTGSLVVEYNYDAWGRIIGRTGSLVGTLGWLNPFRYRGYVYDEETRMYYLKSRYYNPEWGRFINADVLLGQIGVVGSHNLFTYCSNNPVMRIDTTGRAWYEDIGKVWNQFTSFVQGCLQDQVQADIVSDEQKLNAANLVVDGAERLWNSAKNTVCNWWEETAKPWLSSVHDAYILTVAIEAEITYNVSQYIGHWLSENWKTATDGVTAVAGVGGTAYGIIQTVIPSLPVIPIVGQVALLAAGIWGVGRWAGWF